MKDRNKIRLRKYFVWLLVYFGFCLLPLLVAGLIVQSLTDNIFSSFIAYSFTLLISSIYVYDNFKSTDDPLVWSSWFIAFGLMIFFILYPDLLKPEGIAANKGLITVGIIVVLIIFSLSLSYKSIEESISKAESDLVKQKRKESDKKSAKMLETLKKEGI